MGSMQFDDLMTDHLYNEPQFYSSILFVVFVIVATINAVLHHKEKYKRSVLNTFHVYGHGKSFGIYTN